MIILSLIALKSNFFATKVRSITVEHNSQLHVAFQISIKFNRSLYESMLLANVYLNTVPNLQYPYRNLLFCDYISTTFIYRATSRHTPALTQKTENYVFQSEKIQHYISFTFKIIQDIVNQ